MSVLWVCLLATAKCSLAHATAACSWSAARSACSVSWNRTWGRLLRAFEWACICQSRCVCMAIAKCGAVLLPHAADWLPAQLCVMARTVYYEHLNQPCARHLQCILLDLHDSLDCIQAVMGVRQTWGESRSRMAGWVYNFQQPSQSRDMDVLGCNRWSILLAVAVRPC